MNKKKSNKKKKKSLLKFLKDYAAVITIFISILAFLINGIIYYYNKINDTYFSFYYLSVKIDTDNFVHEYQQSDYGGSYYHKFLQAPTLNNNLNKLLYKDPKKVKNYFITYLIIEQNGNIDAQNVKINFKQYGKTQSLNNKNLNSVPVNKKIKSNISEKINYPFPKGEILKIPISICKNHNDYTMTLEDCYYIELKPTSIEYNNKYLFSKKNIPIRGYVDKNVIIDGKVALGKGSA